MDAVKAVAALAFATTAFAHEGLPEPLQAVAFDQKLGATLPRNVLLRDEDGKTHTVGDLLRRRPVVLELAYFRCDMLCPLSLAGLATSLRAATLEPGRDFDVWIVSFDASEGPELARKARTRMLERYARPVADGGIRFFTASADDIARLTAAVGFRASWDEGKKEWAHPSGIITLTPGGTISRYLFGLEPAPRDVRLAVVEAAEGKVGTWSDRALLYCFHYDPATGKYSVAVLNLIRAGGLLTLLVLGVFIARTR